ncbi:MerR family DNA-binding protein [Steroidobacter sp.]|uniref:MerR family DNA-binding protein n=1 Tax=Steroidobacter sp. TaxID=1978227 RepID=UPI001A61D82C|nr:MerR family DNA-binding protein [Steroidobacter sp.]MBL8265697.1 MerR family DNA-binding protein [Steroidobacter sp.]
MQAFSIGRLAKLANVSIDTIRFYEKAGLLAADFRRPSGFREYSQLNLKQLRFIRRGRLLGFSLEEISELLALDSAHDAATTVVQQKLRVIDGKIDELKRWRTHLVEFLDAPTTAEPGRQSILNCFSEESAEAETGVPDARPLHESAKRL